MIAVGRCNKDFATEVYRICVHFSIKKGKEKFNALMTLKLIDIALSFFFMDIS